MMLSEGKRFLNTHLLSVTMGWMDLLYYNGYNRRKVIFATTTAVNDAGNPYDKNFRIAEYNEAVIPELKKLGIRINDLYSVVYPNIDKFVSDDCLHMNEVGYNALACQVVKSIKEAEETLKK